MIFILACSFCFKILIVANNQDIEFYILGLYANTGPIVAEGLNAFIIIHKAQARVQVLPPQTRGRDQINLDGLQHQHYHNLEDGC